MSRKLRIAYFVHSLLSDWNNGNAHFLRGLVRALGQLGHFVTCWEDENAWSRVELLRHEAIAMPAIESFRTHFSDLHIRQHNNHDEELEQILGNSDIAIVHEWSSPELVARILSAARRLPVRLLFHDTHHRASSTPASMKLLQIERFDGVLAFGEALRQIYLQRFDLEQVWTFHEAADTTTFAPGTADEATDVVWIGNWGDEERTRELTSYLIEPARRMARARWLVHGVRYPDTAIEALHEAGIEYGGYLPNLAAAKLYQTARLTLHIPRQQYTTAMRGIPTIRVFEALAAGIPLISAPWVDSENLFRKGDYLSVSSTDEMIDAINTLLAHPTAARAQAERGLETILARHTCLHRAEQLTQICEEVLS